LLLTAAIAFGSKRNCDAAHRVADHSVAHRRSTWGSSRATARKFSCWSRGGACGVAHRDLDFYTAAGTTGRAALRASRVVMVAMNRSDQCVVARKSLPL
jgi:hypothetical protein